ncbi:MAG: hypothetical protein RL748_746 [Pseudomonadota bacterium]
MQVSIVGDTCLCVNRFCYDDASFPLFCPIIMKICVFCASSPLAPAEYGQAAYDLGRIFGQAGVTTIFGGGGVGSMGRLADGVHSVNGNIVGVMPHFMRELEWAHKEVGTFHWTADMAERKALLRDQTDAIVALPGGCGTFEEVLEVITLKRLGLYPKPIIVLNQNNFYEHLIALFERSIAERFMEPRHQSLFTVVNTIAEVLPAAQTVPHWQN